MYILGGDDDDVGNNDDDDVPWLMMMMFAFWISGRVSVFPWAKYRLSLADIPVDSWFVISRD